MEQRKCNNMKRKGKKETMKWRRREGEEKKEGRSGNNRHSKVSEDSFREAGFAASNSRQARIKKKERRYKPS